VNVLANGWLCYQTLGCRLWGRTGFYQSGGAYGFRDQLQDVMALVHAEPDLTRAAPAARGGAPVHRGRRAALVASARPGAACAPCSDDYLWLPYAVSRYVSSTGTPACSTSWCPSSTGRALRPDEESYFDLPGRSEESGTLYEHCCAARSSTA
jgi:cyclic beta-1,2-glucan synthetase